MKRQKSGERLLFGNESFIMNITCGGGSMKNEDKIILCENPILKGDFPDPDVIRVGDTYYMVSTTMHFMPGCVILRS